MSVRLVRGGSRPSDWIRGCLESIGQHPHNNPLRTQQLDSKPFHQATSSLTVVLRPNSLSSIPRSSASQSTSLRSAYFHPLSHHVVYLIIHGCDAVRNGCIEHSISCAYSTYITFLYDLDVTSNQVRLTLFPDIDSIVAVVPASSFTVYFFGGQPTPPGGEALFTTMQNVAVADTTLPATLVAYLVNVTSSVEPVVPVQDAAPTTFREHWGERGGQ